jgi:hypothetical protein
MTSSVNVSTVLTSNTFENWRVQTNLLKDDTNEIARGDFTKPAGNVTLTVGRIVLPNATGTMLDITADARISGKVSLKNFEQDGGAAYLYTDSGDIKFTNAAAVFHSNGNTRTRFLYSNVFFAAANINATGFIETTGATANGNAIMNVGNVLVVRSVANSSNVYVTGNLAVSNIFTIGNLFATQANITTGNITTANVATLNVNAVGAIANIANVTVANSVTTNASIGLLNVTTRENVTLANITTANIATLNVAAVGAIANIANVTVANSITTNASVGLLDVTTRANVLLLNVTTANAATLNVAAAGAVANLANVTVANSTTTNASIGVLNVTTRANVLLLNVHAVGATANFANTTMSNTTIGNLIATTSSFSGQMNAVTANIATLVVTSLTVIDPISAPSESDSSSYRLRVNQTVRGDGAFGVNQGGANGNAYLTFVESANVWRFTSNSIAGVYSTLLAVANISDSVGTTSSVNAASLTAVRTAYDASQVAANTVRVSQNGISTLNQQQLNFINTATILVTVAAGAGAQAGNANVSFAVDNTNPALIGPQGTTGAQGATGTQGTTGTAGSQGTTGAQGATGAQGTTGTTGNTGAQGATGSQGTTGTAGSQGTTGATGSQGATGTQGTTGTTGNTGAQGATGSQGTTGTTGSQGTTGTTGTQGATGTQGTTGTTGTTGNTGPQGTTGSTGGTGSQGATGTNGSQGTTGATGPSTVVNASNDTSSTTLYPVCVATSGSDQTPKVRTSATAFIFNASTCVLSAVDFSASSDARLKTIHGFINNPMDILAAIHGVRYHWNDLAHSLGPTSNTPQVGVIAQEVEAVLPEAIHKGAEGYLNVSYDKLVPVLIEAIKELNERIKILEGK